MEEEWQGVVRSADQPNCDCTYIIAHRWYVDTMIWMGLQPFLSLFTPLTTVFTL